MNEREPGWVFRGCDFCWREDLDEWFYPLNDEAGHGFSGVNICGECLKKPENARARERLERCHEPGYGF